MPPTHAPAPPAAAPRPAPHEPGRRVAGGIPRAALCAGALALLALGCGGVGDVATAPPPATTAAGGYKIPASIDPINLAALQRALAASRAPGVRGPSFSLNSEGEAILSNGTVQIGVAKLGNLNVEGGTTSAGGGTSFVGLRYVPTNNEATAPGCLCEGWGVADAASPTLTAYANKSSGTDGLTEVSFTSTDGFATTATSVVSASASGKQLRVTHAFRPAPETPNLFQVLVTIENTGSVAIGDLRYRRTFDWDVEPTAFDEFVTIQGTTASSTLTVRRATVNGFSTSDPLEDEDDLGSTGDVVDFGPDDIGSNFDFSFGALAAGAKKEFTIFYGASNSETGAINALKAVGAEVYSLGQPNVDGQPSKTTGEPNTFVFAFKGVGGVALNRPPVPTLAPATQTIAAGGSVTFTTGASDPENDTPLACTINYGEPGGSAVSLASCAGTVSRTFATPGTYTVTLSARDPFNATGTATATITVTPAATGNRPPVPTFSSGPTANLTGQRLDYTFTTTDPDGDTPLTCEIDFGDGGGFAAVSSCVSAASHIYTAAGTYTITLRARDPGGLTGTATRTVVITGANLAPVPTLSVTPDVGLAPLAVVATTGATDPNGDSPLVCTLNFGDGTPTVTLASCAAGGSHTYTAAGTYAATLTARDPSGAQGSVAVSVRVTTPDVNTPPEIINLRGFPETLTAFPIGANSCYDREQVCIKYTIRDVDAGDTPFATTVNWGDGSPTYVPNAIPRNDIPLLAFHRYAATGSYTVTVTATDRRGASSTRTIRVTIAP